MISKGRIRQLRWIRRIVQGGFLLLFVVLLLAARYSQTGGPNPLLAFYFDFDPLVLLATALAAHAVPALLWLSLITVALTLVFGRVFCGWICPLGTINTMVSALRRPDSPVLVATETRSPWQRAKYYVLAALVVMALFGAHVIGFLDPFSLLYRASVTGLLPATQYAVEHGANVIYQADPHLGHWHVTSVSDPVYHFFRDHIFVAPRQAFVGSGFILLIFTAIVLLNLYRKRFWCRYLCPLGALLGLCASRPVFRLEKAEDQCDQCGLCKVDCQGAATPDEPERWQPTECLMCMNCATRCNGDAVSFGFASPIKRPTQATLDLSRRALLTSGAAGLAGLLALRLTPQAQAKVFNPSLVRPPGARAEPEFLDRCVQCGLCMKVCPTNGLQPTFLEAGLEGLWTPRLDSRVGYCEFTCNLCGQVCPTQAIQPLTLKDKQTCKIGLAVFDMSRCLPYAFERECMICEEHCPTPKKAIYFIRAEVTTRTGAKKPLKQPRVDPDLCIGCGICEYKCVFRDEPAIRITSANEARHEKNQPILPGLPALGPAPPISSGGEGATDPYANANG